MALAFWQLTWVFLESLGNDLALTWLFSLEEMVVHVVFQRGEAWAVFWLRVQTVVIYLPWLFSQEQVGVKGDFVDVDLSVRARFLALTLSL